MYDEPVGKPLSGSITKCCATATELHRCGYVWHRNGATAALPSPARRRDLHWRPACWIPSAMKMQVPFMQLPLVFDAAALQAEIGAIDESAWRPHPQGYPGNDALTLITVGGDPASDAAAGAMRPTVH